MILFNKIFLNKLISLIPIIILFYLSFNNISLTIPKYNFSSSNNIIVHVLIFYWVIRRPAILPYGFIFLAGFINDVVAGLPIGISSVTYLILAGFAAYIRNLTVHPSLLSDWMTFLPSILITNSIYFIVMKVIFDIEINYLNIVLNTFFTLCLYPLIGGLFNIILKIISRRNV